MSAIYLHKRVVYHIYRSRRESRMVSSEMIGYIDADGPRTFDWSCNGYHGTAESLPLARAAAVEAMKKVKYEPR